MEEEEKNLQLLLAHVKLFYHHQCYDGVDDNRNNQGKHKSTRKIKGEITTENNAKDNIALSNYNNDLGALVIKMGEEKQHRTDNTHQWRL